MGVMSEPTLVPETESVSEEQFKALCDGQYKGTTEIEIKTGLNFLKLNAELYENGKPTNGIINANQPWEVRVSFGIDGPLKELICGYWCVEAHFESIGEGPEYHLSVPKFEFDCHRKYWCVKVPGRVDPDKCSSPYKVVVTVAALSKCHKPVAILGFVELPLVQFYAV
jgi:hypothetical protein